MKKCPICKSELKPLPWREDNKYISADTHKEVIGSVECEHCGIIWNIDYANNEIDLYALKRKCENICDHWEECKRILPGTVLLLNDNGVRFICDEIDDVEFKMEIVIRKIK
jgi:hypothetical protein